MSDEDRGWANYGGYAGDAADAVRRGRETVTVTVADTEISARALTVIEDTLVVGVSPADVIGSTFPADEPVALSTPEETVTARLRDVTFDIEGTLLSFERVEGVEG